MMIKQFFLYRLKNQHIILLAVLSLLMLGVMDIYSLPAIAKAAGGIPAFDLQTFGYSHQTAQAFLNNLSESGRKLFLYFQLPLDFAFAFVYTFLFLALIIRLNKIGYRLCFLPLILFLLDITENTVSVIMLTAPKLPPALSIFGSVITVSKNLFTLLCALVIIVFLILKLKNRRKKK